jgi:hypothetical protein
MKNLFIISEDERKRILGLHENATKRQYLNEEYFNRQVRFWEPLSQTAKDIIKSICVVRTIEGEDYFTIGELLNANEDNFVRYLTSVKNYNDFFKLNTEITNFFNNINIPGLKKYAGIDKIIADIIDKTGFWRGGLTRGDDDNIVKLKVFFEKIGVNSQGIGDNSYTFGGLTNTPSPNTPQTNEPIANTEPGQNNANKWKTNCSGTYSKWCYEKDPNGPIHRVQACIGTIVDGKFGNKTELKLKEKTNKTSFTDSEVDTICNNSKDYGSDKINQIQRMLGTNQTGTIGDADLDKMIELFYGQEGTRFVPDSESLK